MLNDWVGRGGREKKLFEAREIMHRWIKIQGKSLKTFVSSRNNVRSCVALYIERDILQIILRNIFKHIVH